VLKREEHRAAVLAAATSGCARFFLGTDSAPHAKGAKARAASSRRARPPACALERGRPAGRSSAGAR